MRGTGPKWVKVRLLQTQVWSLKPSIADQPAAWELFASSPPPDTELAPHQDSKGSHPFFLSLSEFTSWDPNWAAASITLWALVPYRLKGVTPCFWLVRVVNGWGKGVARGWHSGAPQGEGFCPQQKPHLHHSLKDGISTWLCGLQYCCMQPQYSFPALGYI